MPPRRKGDAGDTIFSKFLDRIMEKTATQPLAFAVAGVSTKGSIPAPFKSVSTGDFNAPTEALNLGANRVSGVVTLKKNGFPQRMVT